MEFIQPNFAELLKPVAQMLYNRVVAISKGAVKAIFIFVIVSLPAGVFSLGKEKVDKDSGTKLSPVEDLRFWTIVILVVQAVMCLVLG